MHILPWGKTRRCPACKGKPRHLASVKPGVTEQAKCPRCHGTGRIAKKKGK